MNLMTMPVKERKPKLATTDQRMLDLMTYCVANRVKGIESNSEWCTLIGIRNTDMANIKNGVRGFSKAQLQEAGAKLGVSMDYLYGFSTRMFREEKKRSSIELLKEAVKAVELELKK